MCHLNILRVLKALMRSKRLKWVGIKRPNRLLRYQQLLYLEEECWSTDLIGVYLKHNVPGLSPPNQGIGSSLFSFPNKEVTKIDLAPQRKQKLIRGDRAKWYSGVIRQVHWNSTHMYPIHLKRDHERSVFIINPIVAHKYMRFDRS